MDTLGMRQRARVNYSDGFDDPFGSSFILPIDQSFTDGQPVERESGASRITTNIVPMPYPELNILLPDYQVDDIVFGYDNLDIYRSPTPEAATEPDYSTTSAIKSLFGENL
jgi:hypothetical protein